MLLPPLYINAITFGLLFFFVYNDIRQDFLSYYVLGFYSFIAGIFQDRIMVNLIGKNAPVDNIIRHSYRVFAEYTELEKIVLTKQFRNMLKLERKIQKPNESLKLRTRKKRHWNIILEIKKTDKKDVSLINFVFYDEGSYNLKKIQKTDDSYEYAISEIEHIENYLSRRYQIKVETAPITNTESLVNCILNDFQGKSSRLQEMSIQKRASIVSAIILSFVSIGLFGYGLIDASITAGVFAIGLVINVIFR